MVPHGGTTNFTITPDRYWHVEDVQTNGIPVGAVTAFTWSNVRAAGAIHAAFDADLAALGTPHWWLASYGLTNAGASFDQAETNDADGDMASAHDEHVADTDPTHPLSCLRVTGITNVPPLTVYFLSSSNRQYVLLCCSNLAADAWTNLPGQTPRGGLGGPDSLTDPNPPAGSNYYRIGVSLPLSP